MTAPLRLLAATLLGLLLALPATAAERGSWWEMTSTMEMAGMPFAMPPTTVKFCQPDGDWQQPPQGKQDPSCQVKELKRSGNTMKWKVACTGQERMEGDGEMTRTGDALAGTTHIRSASGEMTVKMSGKKVGGACDPEEQRRQAEQKVEQIKGQAAKAQAQHHASELKVCDDAVEEMQARAIAGSYPACKDPAKKQVFCTRARTEDGYTRLMRQAEQEKAMGGVFPGPRAAAKACGFDLDEVRRGLCASAARKESLSFLAAACPAEAKVIAKRECAGRGYTAMKGSRYADFCGRLAGQRLDAGGQDDEYEKPEKKAAEEKPADKRKKLLKGVLGF